MTSVCCKTSERDIAANLYKYIDSNGLFNDNQFGFRRGRTVNDQLLFLTQLLLYYGMLSNWYDVCSIVDVVLFGFVKAFDIVSPNLLLDKLRLLGICIGNLITDFLIDRVYLRIRNSFMDIRSSVPLGSLLGPPLFLK